MRMKCGLGLVAILLLSACGFNESQTELSQAKIQLRANEIYEQLTESLRDNFPSDEGKVWSSSAISLDSNWMIQSPEGLFGRDASELPSQIDCELSDPRCDRNFQRLECSSDSDCEGLAKCESAPATVTFPGAKPKNLCLTHADHVWNRVYQTMIEADKELDFVSLALPTGKFRQAIVHALAYLAQKPVVPKVRMLFSGAKPALPNILQSSDRAMNSFLSDIASVTPLASKLPVNFAWLSPGRISWNHSKIIVADGDLAITGGHNLWDKDYLSATPVFDLSMEYRGEGARETREFVNTLWSHVEAKDLSFNKAAKSVFAPFNMNSHTKASVKAISLGRMGILGSNPSDFVLKEMIRTAKSSVYINQQDLFNQAVTPLTKTFVMDDILEAASRGVRFKIVQSNNYPLIGGFGSTNGATAYRYLITALTSRLRIVRSLSLSEAKAEACRVISYASFRFSNGVNKWPQDEGTIGTHAKVVIVDEAAFYIGSHNLYPANLQEHGMVVTDAEAAKELIDQYWSKVWNESSPSSYACPG